MFERVALHGQLLLDRPVVDSAQPPHIIGGRVRAYPPRFQEGLVPYHQVGIHFFRKHVAFPEETSETVQDGGVALGRAVLADLP